MRQKPILFVSYFADDYVKRIYTLICKKFMIKNYDIYKKIYEKPEYCIKNCSEKILQTFYAIYSFIIRIKVMRNSNYLFNTIFMSNNYSLSYLIYFKKIFFKKITLRRYSFLLKLFYKNYH